MATKTIAAPKTNSLQKKLNTIRETRALKNNASVKVASKSDLIRSYLSKNMTAAQIRDALKKRGLGVYASEIYRIKNAA